MKAREPEHQIFKTKSYNINNIIVSTYEKQLLPYRPKNYSFPPKKLQ